MKISVIRYKTWDGLKIGSAVAAMSRVSSVSLCSLFSEEFRHCFLFSSVCMIRIV